MKEQRAIFEVIYRVPPGKTKAARRRKRGIIVFAELIGGMVLAR